MNRVVFGGINKQIIAGITVLVAGCQLTTPAQQRPVFANKTVQTEESIGATSKHSIVAAVPTKQGNQSIRPLQSDQLANKIKGLIETNYLTKPASNSALTAIRQLEQDYPSHPDLLALKQMLASRLMQVANSAHSQNNQAKALYYANVAQQVVPEVTGSTALISEIRHQVKLESSTALGNSKSSKALVKKIQTPSRVTIIQPPANDDDSLIAKTLFESLSDEQRKVLAELPQDIHSVLINIIILNQNEVKERLFDVRYVLDSIVDQMVKENARVVVTTRSMRDSRWLAALLKTRIREVNPYFELNLMKRVNSELKPHIALYAQ